MNTNIIKLLEETTEKYFYDFWVGKYFFDNTQKNPEDKIEY